MCVCTYTEDIHMQMSNTLLKLFLRNVAFNYLSCNCSWTMWLTLCVCVCICVCEYVCMEAGRRVNSAECERLKVWQQERRAEWHLNAPVRCVLYFSTSIRFFEQSPSSLVVVQTSADFSINSLWHFSNLLTEVKKQYNKLQPEGNLFCVHINTVAVNINT